MKKIILSVTLLIGICFASLAQKNTFSLQGGATFALSDDITDISKTIGYCYGFAYNRDLFEAGGATFGLIADMKMSSFLLANDMYSYPYNFSINSNKSLGASYQEASIGLGLNVGHEIGKSGVFYEVNVECLGIYDMEPDFTYVTIAEGGTWVEGFIWADSKFTIGYNFGAKLYKMFTNNSGLGLQVDWIECAPTSTTHNTIKVPYYYSEESGKCNLKYLCCQLKWVSKF